MDKTKNSILMKAKVKKPLNERGGKPSVNAPNDNYYNPGDLLEIIDIVNGDTIDNNSLWFKLDNGKYVWSGGVEGVVDVETEQINENLKTSIKMQNLDIYKNLPEEIKNATGKGVNIAVLDTGICKTHPALKNQILNIDDNNEVVHSHGTRVAGIISANSIDFKGFAPDVKIYDFKVTIDSESVDQGKLINTLNTIYSRISNDELSIQIINLSLDADSSSLPDVIEIIDKITKLGVVVVVAAGDPESPNFVSKLNNVIRVGIRKPGKYIKNFDILFDNQPIKTTGIPETGKIYDEIKDSSAYTAVVSGIIAKYISNNDFTRETIVQNTIKFIKQLTN